MEPSNTTERAEVGGDERVLDDAALDGVAGGEGDGPICELCGCKMKWSLWLVDWGCYNPNCEDYVVDNYIHPKRPY